MSTITPSVVDVPDRSSRDGLRVLIRARRMVRSKGPTLTFVYLAAIWVIFAGVLLAIPHSGAGPSARLLAGLAGL